MGFVGSYLWRLRQRVGSELVLMPGAVVAPGQLKAFACLSRPDLHTIEYENGDVTHCFAMCFWAERWEGELRADGEETRELGFFAPDRLPEPLHPPSGAGLALFGEYLRTGEFQAS